MTIKRIALANPIAFLNSRRTRRGDKKFKREFGIAFTWTEVATILACSLDVTATAVGINSCGRVVFGQPCTVCFTSGVEGKCEVGIVHAKLSCSKERNQREEETFVEEHGSCDDVCNVTLEYSIMQWTVAGAVYNFKLARLWWMDDKRGLFTPQIIPEYSNQ